MNKKDCSSSSHLKDHCHPNQTRPSNPSRKYLKYGFLFALLGLILACDLMSNLPNLALDGTATANASTAQAAHEAQVDLAVLATQTAQASRPSSTPNPPTSTPSSSPIPPTLTETTPLDTPTATNTPETPTMTNSPPTETPLAPTLTPVLMSSRLHFRQGGTAINLQVPIHAGVQHAYTVWAKKGQTMIISVSSPNQDVNLDLRGMQGGQQLVWPASQTTYWWDTLPASQDYAITITTQNPDTYYFLSLEVPANIYFETGAISATIDGYVDVDTAFHPNVLTRVRYLAYASAGQTMTIKLKSPNLDDLSLGVVGQMDGQAYIGYQVKNNGGEIILPTSQGYYLDIYGINGQSTEFTLELTIQ